MKFLIVAILAVASFASFTTRATSAPVAQANDWSQPLAGSATWSFARNWALALVEGGFSDWHLPTRAQLTAAIQNGTLPSLQLGAGSWLFWTSEKRGNRAYAIWIATDANGNVLPAQSGAEALVLQSSTIPAIATRP